jgi:hypothetical protein
LAAKNTSQGFEGQLLHFGAVRLRLQGSGLLYLVMNSLSLVKSFAMAPITMAPSTDIEPLARCNFISQRGILQGQTNNLDDVFTISRITVFVRQKATGIPQ